jgi:hypothetical protein
MELRSVIARLEALSRRLLLRILLTGAPRLVATACGLVGVTFLLDYTLHLPLAVRLVFLLLGVGLLVWVAIRHLIRPLLDKPSLDALALMAERADPSFQDQLISAIQLERDLREGRAVESPELIQATIDDAARRFGDRSFATSISLAPARSPLLIAGAATAVLVALAATFPATFGLWVKRQLLLQDVPWPRAHTLVITVLDIEKYGPTEEDGGRVIVLHVPERTPLQIQVSDAQGNLPDEVDLVTQSLDDDGEQRISMGRAQKSDYFQHIFPPLVRSLSFFAQGGDDDDEVPKYRVHVDRAPRITSFRAAYDYPDYTGLQDRFLPDANISAPEGTRVTMRFEVNMTLSSFDLEFENLGIRPLAMGPDGAYEHSFVVEGNDFYTHRLKGNNDVASADVPRFVITAEIDQAPRVMVDMPDSTSLLVTPNATIPMRGTGVDDYGVSEIGIRWGETGSLTAGAVTFTGSDLVGDTGLGERQVPFFHTFEVRSLVMPARDAEGDVAARPERPIAEGDRFGFRFLAADNRRTPAQPEPHRKFGDYEYQVQVLSSDELQREFAMRQVRLRDRVRDIQNLVIARIDDTEQILTDVLADAQVDAIQSRLWSTEQDQTRISIELQASARQFLRVYDGYLWNRLDDGALTEKVISLLSRAYRSGQTTDPFQVYGEAVTQAAPLVDETQIMGRLTAILRLLIQTSAERSPEAGRRLSRASLVTAKDDRVEQLRGALEIQRLLQRDIEELLNKLNAWEDYLDVIQGFKDLLELQRGIYEGIEKLTKKK